MNLDSNKHAIDPAEQAALLLFRIGFGILCIALPVIAAFSRRALVIIAPIGAVVLIFSALMIKDNRNAVRRALNVLTSPVGLAALFIIFWSALSLLWTPFPGSGAERLFRIVGTAGLAVGAIIALPKRMRATNLYLLAVGVGLSAITLLGLLLFRSAEIDPTALERAAILTTLLAWPAVNWLAIKQRSLSSMAIAAAVGAIAIVFQGLSVLPALMIGAILLGGAINNSRATAVALMSAVTVLIMAAPLIAIVLSFVAPQESGLGRTMQTWADLIMADPGRLLTGHGLDTALRNRISSVLDAGAPSSLLFEIWYELGVLGALAVTTVMVLSIDKISHLGNALAPFVLGCFGFAFSLAVIGLGTSQTWWMTALVVTAIAFAAVANGEYRAQRPVALRSRTPEL
ncbi:MAG: peptide ABC transporter permease [Beijerinckiaceae bacterium]